MIPYDDLVVALATWRARQGLPVVQVAGATPRPARAPTPAPAPARRGPPQAPPRSATPPAPVAGELEDFDGDALVEDSPYDPAGEDYVVSLVGSVEQPGESAAIGEAPEQVTEGLLVPKRGKRNPDW